MDVAKNFPVVTVTGPRQSGKTTMLKQIFPEKTSKSILCYSGEPEGELNDHELVNYRNISQILTVSQP